MNEIKQSYTINAPADRVFRALTDADEITRWFASSAKSDAKTGGRFAYDYVFADTSRNHSVEGEYRDLTPGETVAYSWPAGHAKHPTEVVYTLTPKGGATELTLVHSGWKADALDSMKEHEMGWGFFLSNLKSYLEEGKDQRAAAMGMKTGATV
jgi:uncharacterized protein YndB with AHSA1/START domain